MNTLNTLFLLCSTGFFLYMGTIWRKRNLTNVIIKLYLITSGIVGIILILYKFGFLVKF